MRTPRLVDKNKNKKSGMENSKFGKQCGRFDVWINIVPYKASRQFSREQLEEGSFSYNPDNEEMWGPVLLSFADYTREREQVRPGQVKCQGCSGAGAE